MTTQAQAATSQPHAMTAQADLEVVPCPHQQVTTMASRLRPLRGGPLTWEIFKKAFLDRFFPREMWEDKVLEFINLRQGVMSVHEYSLKFTKFSKYAPSLIFDPRDKMSRSMTGVSDDLQKEFYLVSLHDNMNIYCLMVQAKHVEQARARRNNNNAKRSRSFDGGSSKNRLDVQDMPRFKKRISSQVPSKFPKDSCDRVSIPKFKKVKDAKSPTEKSTFGKCGEKRYDDCLKGTNNCFGCGKGWHKVRACFYVRSQHKGSVKSQPSGSNEAPKKNRFYAFRSKGEQETSFDVVTYSVVIVFIDDILVYSKIESDHMGDEVDPRKTEAVKNWPRTLTSTDIRSFLDLAGYYGGSWMVLHELHLF
ncbi:uncharacterized protein [Solanum lycopersicum]|uniref:uncharacterized protein n=1 Tax=Solanum lycopersicum TaxID=4081 RepID=UPI003748E3D9